MPPHGAKAGTLEDRARRQLRGITRITPMSDENFSSARAGLFERHYRQW